MTKELPPPSANSPIYRSIALATNSFLDEHFAKHKSSSAFLRAHGQRKYWFFAYFPDLSWISPKWRNTNDCHAAVPLYSGWIVGYGIQKVHILTPNSQNGIQKWHAPDALTSLQSSLKLSKARKFGRRCRPMWPAVPIMGYCFILLENRKSMILSFSVKVHLNFRFFFDSCVSDFTTWMISNNNCRLRQNIYKIYFYFDLIFWR